MNYSLNTNIYGENKSTASRGIRVPLTFEKKHNTVHGIINQTFFIL